MSHGIGPLDSLKNGDAICLGILLEKIYIH